MNKPLPLSFYYDPETDIFKIEGVNYAGGLFRGLGGIDKTPEGKCLRILSNENGCLTLEERFHSNS